MTNINLSEVVKLIQIIDSKELKISGERLLILGFENIKNSLVRAINESFKDNNIDENNVEEYELLPTKKEATND